MTEDEAYIAQRCGASWIRIIDSEPGVPEHMYIMATFGTSKPRHSAKRVWKPLRPNWQERAIEHFQRERV